MKRIQLISVLALLPMLILSTAIIAEESDSSQTVNGPLEPVEDEHIHNLFRYSENLYSGSEPASPEAFDTLKSLGVKTVISVDGAKPRLELAKERGMRYVHLPMQYHSVEETQKQALAKALLELEGPIYVHCHHGKHRGPTATTLAMIGLGQWNPETGIDALKQSGTGDYYTDLYASVEQCQPYDLEDLREAEIELPEIAELPAFTDAMVLAQSHFDRLKLSREANFRVPEQHGDISPPHEALQLKEVLHEMSRMPEVKKQPEAFQAMMKGSENAAKNLEDALRDWMQNEDETDPPAVLERRWQVLSQSCTGCHQVFRVKEVEGLRGE